MSVLPISGHIQLGLSLFTVPRVPVTDKKYTATGGVDVESVKRKRTVDAAIDMSGAKELEKIFGGDVSNGDIAIYTKDRLYISDEFQATEDRVQSFLTYKGLTYRIMAEQNWLDQTGTYVYQGRRHVAQN